MKALHPADHEIKAVRKPGGIDNTVALQIDQVLDYPLEDPQTRIVMAPDMCAPLMIETATAQDQYGGRIRFSPTVFGGDGWAEYTENLSDVLSTIRSNFETMTITSESVTVEFTAPALSNQGTITALQFPMHPMYIMTNRDEKMYDAATTTNTGAPAAVFDCIPTKAAGLSGTRAYNGKIVAGCYMPLRLSKFKQHYINDIPVRGWSQLGREVAGAGLPRLGAFSSVGYAGARLGAPINDERFKPLDNTWGVIYLDGYATGSVSIRLRFRMTVEARVFPGSSYAPLAEPPPPPDDLALRMYREIAGRMSNAYPASYNDWAKLKGTVLGIANKILPKAAPWITSALQGLPYGAALSSLAKPILERVQKAVKDNLPKTSVVVAKPSMVQAALDKGTANAVAAITARKKKKKVKKAKWRRGGR